jgi:hypothetical protein
MSDPSKEPPDGGTSPAPVFGGSFGAATFGAVGFGGATTSHVPLVQVASASVYASAGASGVVITPHPGSPMPDIDATFTKNIWDLTTTGVGVSIGAAFGHVPGAVAGGAVFYAWGQMRWRQTQKKVP